jgi:hypothetical protein
VWIGGRPLGLARAGDGPGAQRYNEHAASWFRPFIKDIASVTLNGTILFHRADLTTTDMPVRAT